MNRRALSMKIIRLSIQTISIQIHRILLTMGNCLVPPSFSKGNVNIYYDVACWLCVDWIAVWIGFVGASWKPVFDRAGHLRFGLELMFRISCVPSLGRHTIKLSFVGAGPVRERCELKPAIFAKMTQTHRFVHICKDFKNPVILLLIWCFIEWQNTPKK